MAVPDYQSVMLPLLKFAAQKGTETSTSEAVEALSKELGLVTLHINLTPIFHICLMSCNNISGTGFMGHLVNGRSYPQPSLRPPCFAPRLRSEVGYG